MVSTSKGLMGQMIPQVVAPREIRAKILRSLHNSPTGAHLGRIKTINCVRYRFYWPGYKKDVINWCRRWDTCAQTKRQKAKSAQVPVAGPMEWVAVDIMGPVPQTDNGNLYILVLGDYFSKWTEAFPLKDHTAQTVADVLVEQFVSRFGVSLHSDQGHESESDLISEMCKLLQVRKTRTVPYNPKSDGMIERANRTVIQMLTTLVNEARNDWDDHLPYVMMAYRASVHESTGLTPNKLMWNHETNLPIDLMVGAPPDTPVCPVQYVEWIREASEHAFEFVQRTLRASAKRQKRLYDRKGGLPSEVGDSVWRYNHPGSKLKFGKKWESPYLVTARVNTLCYRIQKSQSSRNIVVHVDHLKMYKGPKPVASWLVPEEQDDTHEAKQRVIKSNDNHDNVDEAVNDPDLLQPQHNLSASNDKLPISIRIPTNHPAEQQTGNSKLHVTVSEESAEQQPRNSDLDETIPFETAEQHTKNTDLDTTIPYETAEQHPENSHLDVIILNGNVEPEPVNSDLDVTIPYGSATEQLSLGVGLDKKSSTASQLFMDQSGAHTSSRSYDTVNTQLPVVATSDVAKQNDPGSMTPTSSHATSSTTTVTNSPVLSTLTESNCAEDARPLAIRRTRQPSKPRNILNL